MNEEEKQNQSSDAHVSSLERSGTPDQTTSQTTDVAPDKPRRRGRPKGSKNKKTLAMEKTTIHTALREDTPVKHTSAAFASAARAQSETLASESFAAHEDAKRTSTFNDHRISTRLPRRTTHATIASQEKTGFRAAASRAPQTYERAIGFVADSGDALHGDALHADTKRSDALRAETTRDAAQQGNSSRFETSRSTSVRNTSSRTGKTSRSIAAGEGEIAVLLSDSDTPRTRVVSRYERRTDRGERAERIERADRSERSFDRADERVSERSERFQERTVDRSTSSSDRNETKTRPQLSKPTTRVYHQRQERVCTPSVSKEELSAAKVADLRARAIELGIEATGLKKAQLVDVIFEASSVAEGFLEVRGVLDILADGYGFLRTQGYLPSETDCYVSMSLIKRNKLRKGDYLVGQTRPARTNEKFAAIQKIISINGIALEQLSSRVRFADLTPVYPQDRLVMEHGAQTITARVIDLVAPIGKGQRGLIVSPPKAGKTTILKDIAASISANNPEVKLLCLLVDERPEEVTDMQRSIKGEVISSTFDMPAENHIAVAEMVIERAKRMVEMGDDVVILLDSITRLARAYNLAQPASGRVLSGGVDSTALYPPKRFLGAARNIEHGGSLTILASALVETGSKMDEVIFEEFKGTGNMELKLDRALADRRIFPAIDPISSGTRKEELLLDAQLAPLVWALRRILANMSNTERAMDTLIKSLKQTNDNQEFLVRTARKAQQSKGEPVTL